MSELVKPVIHRMRAHQEHNGAYARQRNDKEKWDPVPIADPVNPEDGEN